MPEIHSTSIVDSKAEIADDVVIGPFCTVGPDVKIASGGLLVSHCSITGHTAIGMGNRFYPFCAIGHPPQDLEWKNERSYLRIGDSNTFREGFTAHPGTKPESETVIGNNCFFMNHSHVAHNCRIGNRVIMVNGALAGGYSEIGDNVLMSGNTAIHQFCRVGRLAMMGGLTAISKDLPPFMTCYSKTNSAGGLNLVGLRRHGFSRETILALKKIHRIFFRSGLAVREAISRLEADPELKAFPEALEFVDFVRQSKRGIVSGQIVEGSDQRDNDNDEE